MLPAAKNHFFPNRSIEIPTVGVVIIVAIEAIPIINPIWASVPPRSSILIGRMMNEWKLKKNKNDDRVIKTKSLLKRGLCVFSAGDVKVYNFLTRLPE